MPIPGERTFSFEHEDERSMSHGHRDDTMDHAVHQPYRDSPNRDIISPPPHYTSTTAQEASNFMYRSRSRRSEEHIGYSQEQSTSTYSHEASSPPPPPPHLSSPSRSMQRDSISRNPIAAVPVGTMDYEQMDDQATYGQASPEIHYRGDEAGAMHPTVSQPAHYINDPYFSTSTHGQRPPSSFRGYPSYSSNMPLANEAATPGSITPATTPDFRSSRFSGRSIPLEDYPTPTHRPMSAYYQDSPYHNSQKLDLTVSDASINPNDIADDGEDDFMQPQQKAGHAGMSSAAAGSASGAGLFGGLFGKKGAKQTSGGSYDPVRGGGSGGGEEKSAWLAKQKKGGNKMRWTVGLAIGAVIVLAILAGILGGVLGTRSSSSNGGYAGDRGNINNAADDLAHNGDLNTNSAEIKALMNNRNLHKVFPGMDYTPWGVQYPLCLKYPPSQNNVTRDMAVLSQLTNVVRLYGTDCNQTEMVLHAIDRLNLKDMKIWLGVWVDTNTTTTDRQMEHMYKLLEDVKDHSIFKGVIVGNEALYRAGESKEQSRQELVTLLTGTKSNFTSLGYDLPVATSDLGDNWDVELAQSSDYIMSNIHPFFAGVSAEKAADWTMNFWTQKNGPLTTSTDAIELISETGWPSGGGTDCGGTDGTCAAGQSGAVASVANMNVFMEDWVCQALTNKTQYFWFEAFDEPWKVSFNEPGKEWEDKWGLMDSNRVLKSGIKIPDCGGKTV